MNGSAPYPNDDGTIKLTRRSAKERELYFVRKIADLTAQRDALLAACKGALRNLTGEVPSLRQSRINAIIKLRDAISLIDAIEKAEGK